MVALVCAAVISCPCAAAAAARTQSIAAAATGISLSSSAQTSSSRPSVCRRVDGERAIRAMRTICVKTYTAKWYGVMSFSHATPIDR